MKSVVLASQSPRRRELMRNITADFETVVSDVEETVPADIGVYDTAEYLARLKAEDVLRTRRDAVVIGADTIVILDGVVLTKPADEEDAKRMLRLLSDKRHTVVTGCCIADSDRTKSFSQRTEVEFYPLSDNDIEEYVATGEPMDKAGAYGIQGGGMLFVKGIEGDYFNVMGLPVARLYRELKDFMK